MKRHSNWRRWNSALAPEPRMTTLAQALQTAQAEGMARLDAQMLLLHALGRSTHDRAWLLAHDVDPLTASDQEAFDAGVRRRRGGEPLAYITGHKEFFGLDLQVDARVLVPRPDTETLVDWALSLLANTPAATVLDLGTGSGAIALALKASRPDLSVRATDLSTEALTVARSNAARLHLDIAFQKASWLEGVDGRYQLIVSNPPYIERQDRHLADLLHEPLQALSAGVDGLDDLRRIIAQAPVHLQAGGWLLLEHGHDQADAVRRLLLESSFQGVASRRDLGGIERCSGGQLPLAAKP
jgi:release factor glutamine methyltransferase